MTFSGQGSNTHNPTSASSATPEMSNNGHSRRTNDQKVQTTRHNPGTVWGRCGRSAHGRHSTKVFRQKYSGKSIQAKVFRETSKRESQGI